MKIAILGAGPAGLSAAGYLARDNHTIHVYDRDKHLGGLQRSFDFDGVHYDVGTILFFEQHGLLDAFPFLAEDMVAIKYRPVSISPRGSFDRYPFTVKGYLKDNGPLVAAKSFVDLLLAKYRCRKKDTVASYAEYYMGNTVFQKSGLKNYIYRLHNVPDEELDVEFAQKRLNMIERQSLRKILKAYLPGGKKKMIAGPRLVRSRAGFPQLYEEAIGSYLRDKGVEFRLGTHLESIESREQPAEFCIKFDEQTEVYDRVIGTIPISTMLKLTGQEPRTEVATKNLVSLFYTGKFAKPGNTFFNFTFDAEWKRITVFSRFYEPLADGSDYFTVEVTTDDDTSDARKDAVAREFEEHALKYGLLESPPELKGSHISLDAYPVYRHGQMQAIEDEKERLRRLGIDLLGRQGNFEYVISNFVAKRAKELYEHSYASPPTETASS